MGLYTWICVVEDHDVVEELLRDDEEVELELELELELVVEVLLGWALSRPSEAAS